MSAWKEGLDFGLSWVDGHWNGQTLTLSLSTELGSGNLRSWCEVVIAVLEGLISSEVELVHRV